MSSLLNKAKFLFIAICALLGAWLTSSAQSTSSFTKGAFVSGNDTMQYRLLYPKNYNKHKSYPLIVFLHGDGERGSDNEKQLYAVPKALTDSIGRIKYPCFILTPQCPNKRLWVHFPHFPESLQATEEPTFPARWTFTLTDQLIQKLSIDPNRIYLTGYSGGGEGTFDFLTRRPGFLRQPYRYVRFPIQPKLS